MTDTPPILPPSGWYPDPKGTDQQRWWDGVLWTEYVRPRPVPEVPPVTEYVPMQSASPTVSAGRASSTAAPVVPGPTQPKPSFFYNQYDAHEDMIRGKNSFAMSALILGIFCFVIVLLVPFKWIAALCAIAAIVWGILGIRRARGSNIGQATAVWGLVLGGVGLPVALVVMLVMTPSFQEGFQRGIQQRLAAQQLDISQMEADIKAGIEEQTQTKIDSVQCPTAPKVNAGASFECIARTADGTNVLVTVRIQDDQGSYVWQTAG